MTSCTVEDNGNVGVYVIGEKAALRGGMITENTRYGVHAFDNGKVTVAKAEEGKPQTVSKDNEGHDWHTLYEGSEIIGIPQEKINVYVL